MGKEGKYDLKLADTFTLVTPDTETEEDVSSSSCDTPLTAASHPTKLLRNACTKMLKIFAVSVGKHANKMDRSAVRNVAAMFRSILTASKCGASNLGLEHWTTLGFLRAISSDTNFGACLTTPVWVRLHVEILSGRVNSEQDVYKKLQSLRLLQATLESWQPIDEQMHNEIVQQLFQVFGRIVLLCPADLSLLQNPADTKARVLLSCSHSGTIAEELIALLRKLHTMSAWNSAINAFVSQKLYMATEMLGEASFKNIDDADKAAVLAALTLIGGCDPRPRIGLTITMDGQTATINSFTHKGKALLNVHNSSEIKKVPITIVHDSLDVGTFSLSRMSLNEMLLNSWSILLTGPAPWKTAVVSSTVDTQLLRAQQIHLAALNATSVLFRHQSALRKILRQRAPGMASHFSSEASISEHNNEPHDANAETAAANNYAKEERCPINLIETILGRATQTNPLKAHYSYAELAMAALNLTQHLASHVHNELSAATTADTTHRAVVPLPVQPTLIHGVPIYNNEVSFYVKFVIDDNKKKRRILLYLKPFDEFNSSFVEASPAPTCSRPRRPTVAPHVLQIMQMGFTQCSVELAMKRLAPAVPTVEQIVQWILEHPTDCPVVPSNARGGGAHEFDGDSDSDSSDTVDGGSSMNDGLV